MSTQVSQPPDKYITMHSTATGKFRIALDRLLKRLRNIRSTSEARMLTMLAIDTAKAWDAGGCRGERDDLAETIQARLDAIIATPLAFDYAIALVARLQSMKLEYLIAVVAGDDETARAHRAVTAGEADAYVAFANTDAGVAIDRRCRDEALGPWLDAVIAAAVADLGGRPHDMALGGNT